MDFTLYKDVMKDVKTLDFYPKIDISIPSGMLSRPEAHWLMRIPKVIGNGMYVELGTFRGRSTCYMAYGMKEAQLNARIMTIDTFDDRAVSRRFRKDGSIETSKGDGKDRSEIVADGFKERNLDKYIHVIKATTLEAADMFGEDYFEFLFIDADHSYEAVKADFNAWKSKVKDDGVIAFHDAHREEIKKVHAEITDWEEFDRVETLAVWRKK